MQAPTELNHETHETHEKKLVLFFVCFVVQVFDYRIWVGVSNPAVAIAFRTWLPLPVSLWKNNGKELQ